MCLLTKEVAVNVVKDKPIRAYKILYYGRGDYRTPYQMAYVEDDIIKGDGFFTAEGDLDFEHEYASHWYNSDVNGIINDGYEYNVTGGVIHCYCTVDDAMADFRSWQDFTHFTHMNCIKLFEIEIPVGAFYVEGKFISSFRSRSPLNGLDCIAATAIKFIDEIDVKE